MIRRAEGFEFVFICPETDSRSAWVIRLPAAIAEVAERYAVPAHRAGEAYAELALLRGDPSDGLPGVPGVGEKTAATMLNQYG